MFVKSVLHVLSKATICSAVFCLFQSALAQVVINDPVAYWNFENPADFLRNPVVDEPLLNARVFTGQPASGVMEGTDGIVGSALMCDGSSALRLPYHIEQLGTSFSIATWYWQASSDLRMCVFSSIDNYTIELGTTAKGSTTFASYAAQYKVAEFPANLAEWNHVVYTFSTSDGQTFFKAYTNGVFAFERDFPVSRMTELYKFKSLNLGCYRLSGRFFHGMIDEFALWNRALSADEAAAVYQRGKEGLNLEWMPRQLPPIALQSGQFTYEFALDALAQSDGMITDGWMTHAVEPAPQSFLVKDTAKFFENTLLTVGDSKFIVDRANHPDGPYHAELTDVKYRIPMNAAMKSVTQGDFALETWFRKSSTTRNTLLGNYDKDVRPCMNLEVVPPNQLRFCLFETGNNVNIYADNATDLNDGRWHHAVCVRSNDTFIIYCDGIEIGRGADTVGSCDLAPDYFYLARDSRTSSIVLDGSLGDARIWKRSLTPSEVAYLATGGPAGTAECPSTALLADYRIYDGGLPAEIDPTYGYRIALSPLLRQITLTDFTAESWFRTTATRREVLLGNFNSTTATVPSFTLELHENFAENSVRLYIWNTVNRNVIRDAGLLGKTVRDGQWHHLAGVRRDGVLYLYLDGLQVGDTIADITGAFLLGNDYFWLRRDQRTGYQRFDGDIATTRLWNRALSVQELAALGQSDRPRDELGISASGLLAEHNIVQTNSLFNAGFKNARYLRTFNTGETIAKLTFSSLPPHSSVGIGFLLAQLESIESQESDYFALRVDGVEVLRVTLGFGSEIQPRVGSLELFGEAVDPQLMLDTLVLGGENLFYAGALNEDYDEHVYDVGELEALQSIKHSAKTLTIELIASQNQDSDNEGFGVSSLTLQFEPLHGTMLMLR